MVSVVVIFTLVVARSCLAPTKEQKNVAAEMSVSSTKLIENVCGLKRMCAQFREAAILCIPSSNFNECTEKFGGGAFYLCDVNGDILSEKLNKVSPSTAQCSRYKLKLFIKDHFRPDFFDQFKE